MITSLIQVTLRGPGTEAGFTGILLVSKIIILVLVGLYVIFAVRVWVQVRRLERWLVLLRGHGLSIWALVHFLLAIVGLMLALVVL